MYPKSQQWADEAFALMNEYDVDLIEQLSPEELGKLYALKLELWPQMDRDDNEPEEALQVAKEWVQAEYVAHRLRREFKADTENL